MVESAEDKIAIAQMQIKINVFQEQISVLFGKLDKMHAQLVDVSQFQHSILFSGRIMNALLVLIAAWLVIPGILGKG